MSKALNFLGFLFIIAIFTLCCGTQLRNNAGHNVTTLRMDLVEDIVQNVCKVSLDTLSNKNPEEKAKLMTQIEEKLNKSACALGVHGEKYVQLLLKGVRSRALGNQVTDNDNLSIDTEALRAHAEEIALTQNTSLFGTSKDVLVKKIAKKADFLAKTYFNNINTEDERKKAIETLKSKFVESADRQNATLHYGREKINAYVDLIANGIERMMVTNTKEVNNRRIQILFNKNFNLRRDSLKYNSESLLSSNAPHNKELGGDKLNLSKKLKSVYFNINKKNDINDVESSLCDDVVTETCRKIKLVKFFPCQSDKRKISILKLCDGVGDCLDVSDEKECAINAIDSIQSVNRLMTHIDTSLSHNCYPDFGNSSVKNKQYKILNDVLQNQLNFLHRNSIDGSSIYGKKIFTTDTDAVKKTVSEAVNVVDSLSSALDSSICSGFDEDFNTRRDGDYSIRDEENELQTLSPEVCKCNGENCATVCSSNCKKMCWEKYSLSQLQCLAVTGEKLVSLDMLCDGKLDCYDESDEKDCSRDIKLAKFDAIQIYISILKLIASKAASVEHESLRNRLLNLHALVTKLQKISLEQHADVIEVKRIREASFSELSSLYETALRFAHSSIEKNDTFGYLKSLNERLVSALKRSNTGNDKIISSDGCVCRSYDCALPRCSKSCIRACSSQPKLTRYLCGDSSAQNDSVPLEHICNGRKDCLNGDDEEDCKKDVCRSHHLVVLRHKLRDVGQVHVGTILGEVLKSWGVKVESTLRVAENQPARPTLAMLRDIVHKLLHDLFMSYATVNGSRRSDHTAIFEEFYSWSRVVINTLKSCSQ